MNSFTAKFGSRGCHVYRETTRQNITLHQQLKVLKQTNSILIVLRLRSKKSRIGDFTVGYMPRKLSRFVFYFINEGVSVTDTFANITPRPTPIPEGSPKIHILMYFVRKNNAILNKMKSFFNKKSKSNA